MKLKYIGIFLLVFIMNSCAFNSFYYFPDKNEVANSINGEDIYLNYRKDENIHAVYYKKENPMASIFILHGNAGNLSGWQSVAESLWEEGYQTFMVDYPGFGNSDGKAKHKWVIPSAQYAFDYFVNLDEVKNTKKVLLGFSLGANLSLKIGPDNQDQLDAMVVEGLFNNYRDIGIDHTPKVFRFAPWLVLGAKFKGEETVKEWKKPLLVIHSEDDRTCPYWMGKEVYENAGSEKKELWTIKGPHIRGLANYGEMYLDKLRKLIE